MRFKTLSKDDSGREVVEVTEECPVCGDVSVAIWHGHSAVVGDGFTVEIKEAMSRECGH